MLPTALGAVADDRSAGGARSDHRRRCGGPARRRRRRAGSRCRPFVRLSDRSGDRDPASGTCPFARTRLVHGRRQAVRRTGTADPPVPVAAAGPAGRGGSVGDRAVSLRGHHVPPARAADRRRHRAAPDPASRSSLLSRPARNRPRARHEHATSRDHRSHARDPWRTTIGSCRSTTADFWPAPSRGRSSSRVPSGAHGFPTDAPETGQELVSFLLAHSQPRARRPAARNARAGRA